MAYDNCCIESKYSKLCPENIPKLCVILFYIQIFNCRIAAMEPSTYSASVSDSSVPRIDGSLPEHRTYTRILKCIKRCQRPKSIEY